MGWTPHCSFSKSLPTALQPKLPLWSPSLALLLKSLPFLYSKSLPCNLLCHSPTPLCVLGGWCHHSPDRHGYCQIHSHVSCAAAVSRSRSPHSIRPPPDALQKWREKLQMTKTNIIYVEKKKNKTKRGGLQDCNSYMLHHIILKEEDDVHWQQSLRS